MFNRIKQVFSALTAKIDDYDRNYLNTWLNPKEVGLFLQMNLPDQRHSLNVAYQASEMAKTWPSNLNINVLIKCALLHDVGKVQGDVSTIDKIITVVANSIAPAWSASWGRFGRGSKLDNVRHAFYTYFHHAEQSSSMLQGIGTEQLVYEIVAQHHKAPTENDPSELTILRAADDLN